MRLEQPDERLTKVALSRRNLKALLAKLDGNPPASACTIYYETKDGKILWVSAEEDEVHYANQERALPHGAAMHPSTEEAIAKP